jgi:FixJ family two-component response regulator
VRVWLEDRGAGPVLLVAASPTRKASEVLQRVLEKGSAMDKQLANQLQTRVMTVELKGKELERSVCRR